MKLSVIIPNYNGRKTIEKCIDSIMSQEYKSREIILIDDGSTDSSAKIVEEKYPEVKVVKNKKNRGASYTRNRGIELSSGEYIFFIDNDCYLEKESLGKLVKECSSVDIVYPLIKLKDGTIMHPRNKYEEKFPRMSTAFMLKKKSLDKLDGSLFDEDYNFLYEDEDFFTRCGLCRLKAKYSPEVQVIHMQIPKGKNIEVGKLENFNQRIYFFKIRNKILYHVKFREYRNSINFEKFEGRKIFNDFIRAAVSRDMKRIWIFVRAVLWIFTNWRKIRREKHALRCRISHGKNLL